MDIQKLRENRELIAEKVHDAWWREKEKQGFHCPALFHGANMLFGKFEKRCNKCHPDMYPYAELPENVKDYDRVTVDAVLGTIEEIGITWNKI